MDPTRSLPLWPDLWSPLVIPAAADARPDRCTRCGAPSRQGSRIVLHGHGVRRRSVVVPPAVGDVHAPTRIVECWERRFRCTACRAVIVVLPRGVLPRFLYSIPAIVVAFVLVALRPFGEGLSDAEAYDRQGLYSALSTYAEEPYRWRSLGRWCERAHAWWSGWTGDVTSLLVLLLERAGGHGLAEIVRVAVRSHVRWESPM